MCISPSYKAVACASKRIATPPFLSGVLFVTTLTVLRSVEFCFFVFFSPSFLAHVVITEEAFLMSNYYSNSR